MSVQPAAAIARAAELFGQMDDITVLWSGDSWFAVAFFWFLFFYRLTYDAYHRGPGFNFRATKEALVNHRSRPPSAGAPPRHNVAMVGRPQRHDLRCVGLAVDDSDRGSLKPAAVAALSICDRPD